MTTDIDRAIEKLKLVVEKMKVVGDSNYWTMKEHEQIAEWLEELKEYKNKNPYQKYVDNIANTLVDSIKNLSIKDISMYKIEYNKAIDDMVNSLIYNSTTEEIDGKLCLIVADKRIKLIAEQLKKGAG